MGNHDSKQMMDNAANKAAMTERGICPKCHRYQLLKTTEGTRICSMCGHTWKTNKNE